MENKSDYKFIDPYETKANKILNSYNMWFGSLFNVANLSIMACLTIDLMLSFRNPFKPQKSRIPWYIGFTVLMVLFFSDKMNSLLVRDLNYFRRFVYEPFLKTNTSKFVERKHTDFKELSLSLWSIYLVMAYIILAGYTLGHIGLA